MTFDEFEKLTARIIAGGFHSHTKCSDGKIYLVNRDGYTREDIDAIFELMKNINLCLKDKYILDFVSPNNNYDYIIEAVITIDENFYTLVPSWEVFLVNYKLFSYKNNRGNISSEEILNVIPELAFMINDLSSKNPRRRCE